MNSMYGGQGAARTGLSGQGSTGNFGEQLPKGYKSGRLQQFTPEQLELFQSLFSHLGPDSFLSKLAGGDQSLFGEIEAPALRQFGELQGNIASRFSGMGLGARKSSGFQNIMNQAASNFAQDLQGQRMGLQNQAIQDLMSLSSNLLNQKPYENFLTKKKKPFLEQLLGIISPAGGDFNEGGTQNTQNFLQTLMSLIG